MKKTCSAFRDDLPGYRLGEGTPLERERLKAHLEVCADCRAHLAAYESVHWTDADGVADGARGSSYNVILRIACARHINGLASLIWLEQLPEASCAATARMHQKANSAAAPV